MDPFEAVAYLDRHPVDLVFLDIQMPAIDGLRLVDLFNPRPLLVFTTAHSEYAVASYEAEAVDYLLKPFDYARFLKAVTRVRDRMRAGGTSAQELLFVNTGRQLQRIVLSELHYVESDGNYVMYVTDSGRHLVRATIKETLDVLPPGRFAQIHRSYIVAFDRIEKVEDQQAFVSGRMLPIGMTFRAGFMEAIKRFSG